MTLPAGVPRLLAIGVAAGTFSAVFGVGGGIIAVPLLVAQGANDPRVRQVESDQIVEALRSRQVDVQYLVKTNEGHGFHNEENRFDFYRALEAFLARHLTPA